MQNFRALVLVCDLDQGLTREPWVLVPGALIAAEALCEWEVSVKERPGELSGCGEAPQTCREPHEGLGFWALVLCWWWCSSGVSYV